MILAVMRCLSSSEGDAFKNSDLACVSPKTRKLYGPEKPFVKLRPAYSVKLVFLFVVKGIKIKITAKFCHTEHFRFEDTKRIMSPEKFRVFRETGPWTGLKPRYGLSIEPNNRQLPVGLIAQLLEHCTSIAELRVRVPFRPFFCY